MGCFHSSISFGDFGLRIGDDKQKPQKLLFRFWKLLCWLSWAVVYEPSSNTSYAVRGRTQRGSCVIIYRRSSLLSVLSWQWPEYYTSAPAAMRRVTELVGNRVCERTSLITRLAVVLARACGFQTHNSMTTDTPPPRPPPSFQPYLLLLHRCKASSFPLSASEFFQKRRYVWLPIDLMQRRYHWTPGRTSTTSDQLTLF